MNKIIGLIKKAKTFFFFVGSSIISTVVDLALFALFCRILDNWITGSVNIWVATILARILSSILNYILNYFFVFKSDRSHGSTAVKYTILAIAKMLASALLVSGLCRLIPVGTKEVFIKVPVDFVLFFVNFFVQKKFVYN